MKIILLRIILLLCSVIMMAQEMPSSQDMPQVVPPAPNAANFHSFGNTQVSHYTGATNVSIPIWQVKQGAINLPIHLNYSGSNGIKVSQTASQTGLGWVLNAGGMISREIKDQADDLPDAYLDSPEIPEIIALSEASSEGDSFVGDAHVTVSQSSYDSEPDKYMISALGLNFTFYMDKDLNILTIPRNKVKITPVFGNLLNSSGNLSGFNVVDEQGTQYEFSVVESQMTETPGFTDARYKASSWHLTRVADKNNLNEVVFEYDSYLYNYDSQTAVDFFGISTPQIGSSEVVSANNGEETITHVNVKGQKLSKINFKQGSININYSENLERTDVSGEYFVNTIEVKNRDDELIKGIAFDYGYYSNRLQLNQAHFYTDNFTQPSYVFDYDNSENLPDKLSNGIDHWGFYNGADDDQSLEPEQYVEYISLGNLIRDHYGTGNRNPSTEYSTLGVLTKITYPTGGHTEFEYENHSCIDPNFLGPLNHTSHLFNFPQESEYVVSIAPLQNMSYTPFSLEMHSPIIYNSDEYYAVCSVYYSNDSIYYESNPSTLVGFFNFNPDFVDYEYGLNILPAETIFYGEESGDYTFQLEFKKRYGGAPLPNNAFENTDPLTLNWKISWVEEDPSLNKLLGGIRIKETKDYTKENLLAITKQYSYIADNGNSSGIMFSTPKYNANLLDFPGMANDDGMRGRVRLSNLFNTHNSKGSHVGYSIIKEEKIVADTPVANGYSEYYYSTNRLHFSEDNYYTTIQYPNGEQDMLTPENSTLLPASENSVTLFPPPVYKNIDYSRGLLEKEIHYNYLNEKVYQKTNTYFHFYSNLMNFQTLYDLDLYDDNLSIQCLANAGVGFSLYYTLSSGFSLLTSSEERSYFNGEELIKNTSYTYAPLYQNVPLTVTTSSSEGNGHKVENTYVFNQDNPSTTEDILREQCNGVYTLLSSKTYNLESYGNSSGELLSSQKVNYESFEQDGVGNVYLSTIKASKGDNALEDKIVYHAYNEAGNPTEVSKKDGTHVVYIWGYQQTQPIAKIENFSNANITPSLDLLIKAAITTSSSDIFSDVENELRTALNALRNAPELSNSFVTTYTYDPLIGVTSITDPRGKTVYYEYDDFNRLKQVKDSDGNILSSNDYNYKQN